MSLILRFLAVAQIFLYCECKRSMQLEAGKYLDTSSKSENHTRLTQTEKLSFRESNEVDLSGRSTEEVTRNFTNLQTHGQEVMRNFTAPAGIASAADSPPAMSVMIEESQGGKTVQAQNSDMRTEHVKKGTSNEKKEEYGDQEAHQVEGRAVGATSPKNNRETTIPVWIYFAGLVSVVILFVACAIAADPIQVVTPQSSYYDSQNVGQEGCPSQESFQQEVLPQQGSSQQGSFQQHSQKGFPQPGSFQHQMEWNQMPPPPPQDAHQLASLNSEVVRAICRKNS
eukprot:gnl/MRDRNA2_/MRDRNA2_163725_c0_seq1.p1 gnl/MRDRNA2_/MRDRNA2_163725_c0~~gnl/MRDRNA2_/MRDRNA2_163725_c0_seq1.p1  ORF type:complete len:283 (-),score=42.82 gnl/MRDRNA2_/MRDRNA2_163725_c0_seq1:11-859(-)